MSDEIDREMVARMCRSEEWAAMWRLLGAAEHAHWTRLAREFAQKDKRPDYGELQWQRGFFAACQMIRVNAETVANQIERILAERREVD